MNSYFCSLGYEKNLIISNHVKLVFVKALIAASEMTLILAGQPVTSMLWWSDKKKGAGSNGNDAITSESKSAALEGIYSIALLCLLIDRLISHNHGNHGHLPREHKHLDMT